MIGPILLAVTWLLLRLERRSLAAIGIDRPRRRLAELAVGFLVFGAAAAVQQLGLALATGDAFVPNDALSRARLLDGARFVVNSVLFEELVFRGYLLFQGVRFLGPRRAVWLAAAAFGIYHWFSYGVFGSPIAMAYVLVMTGAMGLAWARAFVATGSVAAPIGMHLGWNAVSYLGFSAGPLGAMLLVPASGTATLQATGIAAVLLSIAWPLAIVWATVACCAWYERPRWICGTPSVRLHAEVPAEPR